MQEASDCISLHIKMYMQNLKQLLINLLMSLSNIYTCKYNEVQKGVNKVSIMLELALVDREKL